MTLPYGQKRIIELFEELARNTWGFLAAGLECSCVPSEETLTDLNLLNMARAGLPFLLVHKASKIAEGRCGFDWEWWIGGDKIGWIRYAVQAKKLNLRTNKYMGLRQKVKGKLQLEVLKDFAKCQGAIPLYCFYNFINEEQDLSFGPAYWNCYKNREQQQLGCTLAPLEAVETTLEERGAPDMLAIHLGSPKAMPWRCLFSCVRTHFNHPEQHSPFPIRGEAILWRVKHPETKIYRELPRDLAGNKLDSRAYASNLGGVPKRVMIVNTTRMLGLE